MIMSPVYEPEVLIDLIDIISNYRNQGFARVISGLDSYEPDDLLEYLNLRCKVYVAMDDGLVQGIFIFSQMPDNAVAAAVCVMNNKYEWIKFFQDKIVPDIANYAETMVFILRGDQIALVELYRRYGYKLKWSAEINRFIYLQKL